MPKPQTMHSKRFVPAYLWIVTALLCASGNTARASDEPSDAAQNVKAGTNQAVNAVDKGVRKGVHAVKHGIKKALQGTEKGLNKADSKISDR
jgi:hypothetical protein